VARLHISALYEGILRSIPRSEPPPLPYSASGAQARALKFRASLGENSRPAMTMFFSQPLWDGNGPSARYKFLAKSARNFDRHPSTRASLYDRTTAANKENWCPGEDSNSNNFFNTFRVSRNGARNLPARLSAAEGLLERVSSLKSQRVTTIARRSSRWSVRVRFYAPSATFPPPASGRPEMKKRTIDQSNDLGRRSPRCLCSQHPVGAWWSPTGKP
jgi:hypothetical protein